MFVLQSLAPSAVVDGGFPVLPQPQFHLGCWTKTQATFRLDEGNVEIHMLAWLEAFMALLRSVPNLVRLVRQPAKRVALVFDPHTLLDRAVVEVVVDFECK